MLVIYQIYHTLDLVVIGVIPFVSITYAVEEICEYKCQPIPEHIGGPYFSTTVIYLNKPEGKLLSLFACVAFWVLFIDLEA